MAHSGIRRFLGRHRALFLALVSAGVLAFLALSSWPEGLAARELVREELRQLRNTEWAASRNDPARVQSFAALGRIVEDLGRYVDTCCAADPKALRGELDLYALEADNLSTSPVARED